MKLCLAVFLTLTGLCGSLFAETIKGKVVAVSDGDTITVLDAKNVQYKIRLAGIDAPEKSQAFGERSKQHLSDKVFGAMVNVEWSKTDKYGRTIGKVIVGGQDANLNQIQAGLAWHYKQYEKEQTVADRTAYAQAEKEARAKQVGLWNDTTQIAPWDFRHGTGMPTPELRGYAGGACPCAGGATCTGPRGGSYCLTSGGNKRYR